MLAQLEVREPEGQASACACACACASAGAPNHNRPAAPQSTPHPGSMRVFKVRFYLCTLVHDGLCDPVQADVLTGNGPLPCEGELAARSRVHIQGFHDN